ncbi:uncharacterized protein PV06_10537 [Exophiala oligosperma]|uniref:Uncharacterized protein n=1 Tax=Exophiala oligosperma TaxID=215243 RepID=A0A0D2DNZ1_9EURO|nr:uncharacterized protein PV06_10537 [Exophiala oligosperma]KIW37499.1 hypothetical protein PV06_10537 [Exophiala oligosperma]
MADLTPVIIGVGEIVNRSLQLSDGVEPAILMIQAIKNALMDTGLNPPIQAKLKATINSIDVVRSWTWPYDNLPGLLA